MAGRPDKLCKVVCLHGGPGPSPLPEADRELQAIELLYADGPGPALRALGKKGDAILMLTDLSEDGAAFVKGLRAQEAWSDLPVFAVIASDRIEGNLKARADEMHVELLPWPMPAGRLWSHLREAAQKYRLQLFRNQLNRRKHFRTPLAVTAYCPVEVRTVDISVAGIQFLANHAYSKGDRGMLDIPSLRDLVGGNFSFEVVAADPVKGEYSHRVRARFVDLDPACARKLEKALALLETLA
ncbi:MAG: PilZ domain-containing protein [Planctomycetes bacterium]|nr:PilZ domain-containing protein [Planctomycetota bacterium]